VLVDYWGEEWQRYCDDVIEFLLTEGYQPILAHPERMKLADEQLEKLLVRLQIAGVQLQGNLRCIAGAEGPVPERRMQRWLCEDPSGASRCRAAGRSERAES
jgi:tyrosine-protein phosphatase YwqE